jgi:hypothetical protein
MRQRRITSLLTYLSAAFIAMALLPVASFAQPALPPDVYVQPGGLGLPASVSPSNGLVTAMVQVSANPPAGTQTTLAQQLASAQARVLFRTHAASNGVVVTMPASKLGQLAAAPGVASVRVIPPKYPATLSANGTTPGEAAAAAIAGATGAGVRIGLIDRGIDYTHADFGGLGTPAAYAANNPTLIETGSFPTAKVIGGYDFAGDAYDANATGARAIPAPDPDPLECRTVPAGTAAPAYIGQGTHVAGLMAGYGVTSSGATYRGPYTPDSNTATMRISPGVAPEATIYALKVFGCTGATTLLTAAIDRALDPNNDGNTADHLDVLVISLGTPFGSPDDPDALAIDNAVRSGVVVVVAAGDTENTFYSVNSPASARLAIAVGATNNSAQVSTNSARGLVRGNGVLKPDVVAASSNIPSAAVGTGSDAMAMSGTADAAAQVGGAAAALIQQHSNWPPALIKAALINSATPFGAPPSMAGGGRLNLSTLSTISVVAYAPGTAGGLSYGAPWVASTIQPTRTLVLQNTGATDQDVTLAATAVATETGVTVQLPAGPIHLPANSSVQTTVSLTINPNALDFSPDPSTAQSQNGRPRFYLAEHGGYIQVVGERGASGTRVRPAHAAHFPSIDFYLDDTLLDGSLDSREVQDYITTTAGLHVVRIRRENAAPNAAPLFSATVNLQDGHDYTLTMIGRPGALAILPIDDTITAAPPAAQALVHYANANIEEPNWKIGPVDVYLDGVLQVAALNVGATSAYQAITPGSHEVAFFQTGANPATEKALTRKTFVAIAGDAFLIGTGRHDDDDDDLTDLEQRVFIGRSAIRFGSALLATVPYTVLPTAAALADVNNTLNIAPGARSFALPITNTGARNTGLVNVPNRPATPETPLASAFELAAGSPVLSTIGATLRPADVRFVGVTSSYSVTRNLDQFTYVYFGMASYAPWATPNEVEYQVWIDANRDGRDDFLLVNANQGELAGGMANDVFINVLYPLSASGAPIPTSQFIFWGTYTPPIQSSIDLAPFNSSVMFQRAKASDLAMPSNPADPNSPKVTPTRFCYHVETRARALNGFKQIVDRVPDAASAPQAVCGGRSGVLYYDIQNPAIAPINTSNFIFSTPVAARPIFLDVQGGAITGLVRGDVLTARGGAKLLVLHHHNAPFPQAEVVDVRQLAVGTP